MSSLNPRRRTPASFDEEIGLSLKTSNALRKGATFHSPPSPSSDSFAPPSLSRSQTTLDDVVDANRRRMALTLSEVEEALATSTAALSLSPSESSGNKKSLTDKSIPIPRGLLNPPVVDPAMASEDIPRRVLRPRTVRRTRQHGSDSGLGSSVASTNDKCSKPDCATNKGGNTSVSAGAITRSAAAASASQDLPSLGRKAIGRIHAHTLRPLLEKPTLKDFQPIVLDVPRKIRSKEIICLRDLEKTLIFMAPEKAKTAALYLDFCLTTIRSLQATVEFLSDREQTRPGDRPYTNGYFIDLKDQILQYGRQLAQVKEDGVSAAAEMDFDQSDEIKLYGGIAENGRAAELIRVKKDGTAISLATGKVIDLSETPLQIKRSLSEQLHDEEEIMRSMARRKKNASPEELAPKKCREPGCNKEFKRPCDLTKHEKTHSRPWKCPYATCKYHEFGWPTEKEMDRHVNDKHSDAPAMYECLFKPCPYKSKRESNCKQHMEKAHGWQYVRTKTNGKKPSISKPSSVQQTPPLGNVSTPSTDPSFGVPTPPHDPFASTDFPPYPRDQDWLAAHGLQTESLDSMDLILENPSPVSVASYEHYPPYQNGSTFIINDEDLYAAHMRLPADMTEMAAAQLYNQQPKMVPEQMTTFQSTQNLPTANQARQPIQAQNVHRPQFSPSAQQNAMLYAPDDGAGGFDNSFNAESSDFQLFSANHSKAYDNQAMFGEIPSANLGFSQTSQDMFNQIDLSNFDCNGFPE